MNPRELHTCYRLVHSLLKQAKTIDEAQDALCLECDPQFLDQYRNHNYDDPGPDYDKVSGEVSARLLEALEQLQRQLKSDVMAAISSLAKWLLPEEEQDGEDWEVYCVNYCSEARALLQLPEDSRARLNLLRLDIHDAFYDRTYRKGSTEYWRAVRGALEKMEADTALMAAMDVAGDVKKPEAVEVLASVQRIYESSGMELSGLLWVAVKSMNHASRDFGNEDIFPLKKADLPLSPQIISSIWEAVIELDDQLTPALLSTVADLSSQTFGGDREWFELRDTLRTTKSYLDDFLVAFGKEIDCDTWSKTLRQIEPLHKALARFPKSFEDAERDPELRDYHRQRALAHRPEIAAAPKEATPAESPPLIPEMPKRDQAAGNDGMTAREANIKVAQLIAADPALQSLLKTNPWSTQLSYRRMAEKVGCSHSTMRNTDFWSDLQSRRQATPRPTAPKAIPNSQVVLERLLAEQSEDAELSPLDPDPIDDDTAGSRNQRVSRGLPRIQKKA